MNLHTTETISSTVPDGSTGRMGSSTVDKLHPFPEGWYLVTTRENLLREKLIEKQWMVEDIVAWRDNEDRICVADAECPHLGSNLGPSETDESDSTLTTEAGRPAGRGDLGTETVSNAAPTVYPIGLYRRYCRQFYPD